MVSALRRTPDAAQLYVGVYVDDKLRSTSDYRLDDELSMFVSDEAEHDAHSSLYRVTDSGVEKAVSTVGDIWSIGRVR